MPRNKPWKPAPFVRYGVRYRLCDCHGALVQLVGVDENGEKIRACSATGEILQLTQTHLEGQDKNAPAPTMERGVKLFDQEDPS